MIILLEHLNCIPIHRNVPSQNGDSLLFNFNRGSGRKSPPEHFKHSVPVENWTKWWISRVDSHTKEREREKGVGAGQGKRRERKKLSKKQTKQTKQTEKEKDIKKIKVSCWLECNQLSRWVVVFFSFVAEILMRTASVAPVTSMTSRSIDCLFLQSAPSDAPAIASLDAM